MNNILLGNFFFFCVGVVGLILVVEVVEEMSDDYVGRVFRSWFVVYVSGYIWYGVDLVF